jgi:hypothetical protein
MSLSTILSGGYRRASLYVVKMYWVDIAGEHRRRPPSTIGGTPRLEDG